MLRMRVGARCVLVGFSKEADPAPDTRARSNVISATNFPWMPWPDCKIGALGARAPLPRLIQLDVYEDCLNFDSSFRGRLATIRGETMALTVRGLTPKPCSYVSASRGGRP